VKQNQIVVTSPQHFAAQAQSLLGYVEMRFDPPISLLNRSNNRDFQFQITCIDCAAHHRPLLHDKSALSVFLGQTASHVGIRAAPSSLGFMREMWNSTMTADAVAAANNGDGPHGE
jgi:hypothetical protein